jgi:hypothetical protein
MYSEDDKSQKKKKWGEKSEKTGKKSKMVRERRYKGGLLLGDEIGRE